MYYPATFTPHTDGTGRYDVTFADLPGCVSQGASLEDAIRMAQEALGLHIGSMVEDGDTLPEPSSLEGARRKDEQEAKEEGYAIPDGTLYQFVVADVKKKEAAPIHFTQTRHRRAYRQRGRRAWAYPFRVDRRRYPRVLQPYAGISRPAINNLNPPHCRGILCFWPPATDKAGSIPPCIG